MFLVPYRTLVEFKELAKTCIVVLTNSENGCRKCHTYKYVDAIYYQQSGSTVNPLLNPCGGGGLIHFKHVWGGFSNRDGGLTWEGVRGLFNLANMVVSVLHKELECKVDKLKYKKGDLWNNNPSFHKKTPNWKILVVVDWWRHRANKLWPKNVQTWQAKTLD